MLLSKRKRDENNYNLYCSSLKFTEEMKVQAELLELAGNCVLSVIYPTKGIIDYKTTEIADFSSVYFKKLICLMQFL